MPSNITHVCVPCRTVKRDYFAWKPIPCPSCKGPMTNMRNWSAPKKSNNRAWKRIEQGEWLWDRRRVRRHNDNHYAHGAWMDRPPRSKGGPRRRYASFIPSKNGPKVDFGG